MSAAAFDLMMAPLERSSLTTLRREVVAEASGTVLELGAGTGVNLPYYDRSRVSSVHLTDLNPYRERILGKRREVEGGAGVDPQLQVSVAEADVERLPFGDGSFDAVVFTLLFCSVAHPERGMREILRVLKPGSTAFFIEHVLPPAPVLAGALHAITPAWRRVAGNCHLDRDTVGLLRKTGFRVTLKRHAAWGIFVAGSATRE